MVTNWKDSKAKSYVSEQFETGRLDPNNLPNLKEYKESNPELFGDFQQKNFSNNIRNLAKKYIDKWHSEDRKMDKKFSSKLTKSVIPFSFLTNVLTFNRTYLTRRRFHGL